MINQHFPPERSGSHSLPVGLWLPTTAACPLMPFLLLQLLSEQLSAPSSLCHTGHKLVPFFLRTLQDTCLSWGDKMYTRAFMFSPLPGLLVRGEPFLAKAGLGVKQNLPFFSITYALGPK